MAGLTVRSGWKPKETSAVSAGHEQVAADLQAADARLAARCLPLAGGGVTVDAQDGSGNRR